MSYKNKRKRNFRTSEATNNDRNSALSRLMTLLSCTVFLTAFSVTASEKTTSVEALTTKVTTAYQQEVAQTAKIKHWPDYQLEVEVRVPPAADHLPQCTTPVMIEGRDSQKLPIGQLRRTVSCADGSNTWHINISLKSALTLPVVVAGSNIQRAESLTHANLALETRTLTRDDSFFTSIVQATDHRAERRIRAGQVIDPARLSAIPLIEKGNEVVLIASKNGFSARTKGVALQGGRKGEQIEVQNLSSEQVVRAVVSGPNQVHTLF